MLYAEQVRRMMRLKTKRERAGPTRLFGGGLPILFGKKYIVYSVGQISLLNGP